MNHQLKFFIPPHSWFTLLDEVAATHHAEIVFERPRTARHESGIHLVTAENLMEVFHDGEYRDIWLSTSLVPAHDKDWAFTKRTAPDLLHATGGRWSGDRLAIRTLVVFAKESRVHDVYSSFATAIRRMCQRGMRSGGQPRPYVYYVPNTDWTYVSDLDVGEEYTPL